MLVDEHALGKSQCFECFKKFKICDFDVRKEERGRSSKKFKFQALLDEDDAQTQKPGEPVNTERYRQQMMDLNKVSRVKNNQNIKRGNTKWFCFMIMHHRTQQNRSRKRLRRLVCQYFRMRLTQQTWFHPITNFVHRWDTHLLSSVSLLTKMYENDSMIGLPQ